MAQSGQFELIIFDCDGVLVDYELISKQNLATYLTELGMPHTLEECLARYVGLSMSAVVSDINNNWGALPDDFPQELRMRNFESSKTDLQAIPNIKSVLETLALETPTLAKCVASSGHPVRIRQSLSITGLLDFFDSHVFSTTQVENGKPAPDLFLFAAEQMSIAPENALVIEDSIAGVQAAVASGMQVFGFTGGGHISDGHDDNLRAEGTDYIFNDMSALPDLLLAT